MPGVSGARGVSTGQPAAETGRHPGWCSCRRPPAGRRVDEAPRTRPCASRPPALRTSRGTRRSRWSAPRTGVRLQRVTRATGPRVRRPDMAASRRAPDARGRLSEGGWRATGGAGRIGRLLAGAGALRPDRPGLGPGERGTGVSCLGGAPRIRCCSGPGLGRSWRGRRSAESTAVPRPRIPC